MNERGSYPEASPELLSSIFEKVLGSAGPVKNISRMLRGHGHESWVIYCDHRNYLFKIALNQTAKLAMRNLSTALFMAHQGGVATPGLLHFREDEPLLSGRTYLIQDFLEGEDAEVNWNSMSESQRHQFFVDFGSAVGKLHSLKTEGFSANLSEDRFEFSWSKFIEVRLARLEEKNRNAGVLSKDILDVALNRIRMDALELEEYIKPSLVHRDLYLPNVLVSNGKFKCLLDFEHAIASDPVLDFVKLRMWVFEKEGGEIEFLKGYSQWIPPYQKWDERLNLSVGMELLSGFPYWKKTNQMDMQQDYLTRFGEWYQA